MSKLQPLQKEIYISKEVQYWIDRLIDLFCLEQDPPKVELRMWNPGRGYYQYANHTIYVGCKNGVKLSTLAHEMIHSTGFDHEFEINGWANFLGRKDLDNFSPLIVKDLTGKKELII